MHKPIRDLLEIIDNTPLSLRKIEEHSGVGSYVIGQWQRSRYGANLSSVIAVGDFLGYELANTDLRKCFLVTLSACETAVGDDRAALGLAGIAIKAGARSAVATLWHVADKAAADLVSNFYRELQTSESSRAQALQRAQIALLDHPDYQSPFFWSPFLLINNWF